MIRTLVPARDAQAFALDRGDPIRMVNPRGTQVVDIRTLSRPGSSERRSPAHTRVVLRSLRIREGDALQSNMRRPMPTIEDTGPGVHDMLSAASDSERYRQLGRETAAPPSAEPFLDGYALTILGLALITLKPDIGLDGTESGLVAAAALIGIFVGGAVFGYVTDRVGRQVRYIIDLLVLTVASLACAFIQERGS